MAFRFDRAVAALRYEGEARDLVHHLKFRRRAPVAATLGTLLAARAVAAGVEADVVVPVPLAWRRRLARGFNQAALIAEVVARGLNRPLRRRVLRRVGGGEPQATRTGSDRRRLGRASFAVRRPRAVRGRRVLLVDDVMTTGATASRCADLLKTAGAASVTVAVASRSV